MTLDWGQIAVFVTALLGAGGLGALFTGWLAHRQTREGAVDSRMLTFIDTLQGQVQRLTAATDEMRVQLDAADRRADEMESQHWRCEQRLDRLQGLMASAGIEIPDDVKGV